MILFITRLIFPLFEFLSSLFSLRRAIADKISHDDAIHGYDNYSPLMHQFATLSSLIGSCSSIIDEVLLRIGDAG